MTVSDDLEPITPREAVDRWIDSRREEATTSTVESYEYRLDQFLNWVESDRDAPLLNLNDLGGRDLQRFWEHRNASVEQTTMRNEFGTLTSWLEWCVAIEAVEPDLPEAAKAMKPQLSRGERVNDVRLSTEQAGRILDYLDTFEYATREHAMMLLLWRTGCRISGLRALDVKDFDAEGQALAAITRPNQGTRLKNGARGERLIALADETIDVLQSYIKRRRISNRDEFGRRPLLTTERGRASKSLVRKTTYQLTHPCIYGPCPHEMNPDTCEFREHGHESKCPSALSPHKVRTGSISWMRERGVPIEVISERCDLTPETLRHHYDRSDPRERLEQRREHIDQL